MAMSGAETGRVIHVLIPVAYTLSLLVIVVSRALAASVPTLRSLRSDPTATLKQDGGSERHRDPEQRAGQKRVDSRLSTVAMRYYILIGVLILLTVAPVETGQSQVVTSVTAKDHVGEVATVCGQVAEYSCRPNSPLLTLTFAPIDQPDPVSIRIADADRTRFGRRLEDEFFGQIVCAVGTIEKAQPGFQVTVLDPTHAAIQKQDRFIAPPRLGPANAHSACDPGVQLPEVTRDVKPRYTPDAMRDQAQGTTTLRIVVLTNGTVGDIQVMRPLHPQLDIEAARAAKQWRFRPGTYMGATVPVIVNMEMTFTLRK
jgi:TonB family protein